MSVSAIEIKGPFLYVVFMMKNLNGQDDLVKSEEYVKFKKNVWGI